MLALTATASPPVRREIVRRLNMRDPAVVIRGFDRPNLHLGVREFREADEKREALVEAVAEAEPPGIVYVATRAGSEELAEELKEKGVNAEAYHAGLAGGKREKLQEDFMDGRLDVIAATTAFGMGIDKENVRFVFHSEISDSVDSYYQEIGRAGRDGEPASACLFYLPQDQGLRRSSQRRARSRARRSSRSPTCWRRRTGRSTRRTCARSSRSQRRSCWGRSTASRRRARSRCCPTAR